LLCCAAHALAHHVVSPAWGQLALDTLEYGAAPVVAYWLVIYSIRGLEATERLLLGATWKLRKECQVSGQAPGAIRATIHMSLCMVQLWVAVVDPHPPSPGWSSSEIYRSARARLLASLHAVAHGSSPVMVSRPRGPTHHGYTAAVCSQP
jgi:hypothetical protein